MIHKAEGYLGVADYAKLCGVSTRNIRDRIRAKSIRCVKIDNFYAINASLSPPVRRINPHRLPRGKALSTVSFSFDGLRQVGSFARGKHISAEVLFEAILTGKLDGYVIGDKVYVKPAEAEQFYKNRP